MVNGVRVHIPSQIDKFMKEDGPDKKEESPHSLSYLAPLKSRKL